MWGKRWANVFFRSLHLCGVGVYTGGVFFGIATDAVMTSYLVTAFSGLAIMVMDLYTNGKWIFQNRGFIIIIKIVLLGLLPHTGYLQKWGIIGIIIISSLISHATADFRYYSIFHRKRI
ncbi:MAG: hypothetical protein MJE63_11600 [Proteobacteria bacterium]|nr:hypothetical protein [Pseudomonadota bacterium]